MEQEATAVKHAASTQHQPAAQSSKQPKRRRSQAGVNGTIFNTAGNGLY
jgi:hypothetical protein